MAACEPLRWQLRPQAPVRKCPARTGFQIDLELGGLFAGGEGNVGSENPRSELGSVRDGTCVVFGERGFEVACQADVRQFGVRVTLEKVDVVHGVAQGATGLLLLAPARDLKWNLEELRPSFARCASYGWWRRRELGYGKILIPGRLLDSKDAQDDRSAEATVWWYVKWYTAGLDLGFG